MFSWSFIRRFWERPSARAALATLPVLAVTAWLFFEARYSEKLFVEAETARQAEMVSLQLQGLVGNHVGTLENVASYVLAVPDENAPRNFVPFVRRLLTGKTDFEGIAWHDAQGQVREQVTVSDDAQALAIPPTELVATAERKAAANGQPVATPSFNLSPGQTALTVVVPLIRDGKREGYVEGTIRLTRSLQSLFGRDVTDFWNLALYDRSGHEAYRDLAGGQSNPTAHHPFAVDRHVPVADHAWRLRLWPTPLLVASLHSGAPWRILGIGLVTTALLAFANALLTQHQARLTASLRESTRLAADVETTRNHLSALVNGVEAAIWESDAELQRFTFVNDYARKLLGVSAEDWVSEPAFWLRYVHPEDRDRALASTRAVQAPGETHTEEYRMVDADSQTLWVREIVTAIGTAGQVTGWRGVVVDTTARVQAEEALRQSQKLESIGVLAGGIAHDFNNLLTTILGNAEMLKPFLETSRSGQGRVHLDKIERTTRRLADLTRQMLAYSGRGRFSVEPIDLNAVIREMTELLAVSLPKNVQVSYRLDPGAPLMDGAPTQIRQVILNLLTNAAEAIGNAPEGHVLVRTSVLELDVEAVANGYAGQDLAAGRYVQLEVSDNGCGMSDETLSKIFDPFFTTKFTGRGLGLAALRGIVRGHHGGIHISSRIGEGTVFNLVFPLVAPTHVSSDAPVQPAPDQLPLEAATVLVVDDEEGLRSLMVMALEEAGCTVHQAADGVEALERFAKLRENLDLIVLDLTMPRLGGEEVLRRIRVQQPEQRVILCSGYTEEDIVRRFDGPAPTAFVEKPFKPSELVKKAAEVLARPAGLAGNDGMEDANRHGANGTHKNGRKVSVVGA